MPMQNKKIWVKTLRMDQTDASESTDVPVTPGPVSEVHFLVSDSPEQIKHQLRTVLKIKDDSLILKLRNHRGSLIVLSDKLATNSKTVPYTLEVTRPHQTVPAKSGSVSRRKHVEALKSLLRQMLTRLDKLEFESQNISERRNDRISQAMTEITHTLEFLNKRIGAAETTKWQGMFKKNPLW